MFLLILDSSIMPVTGMMYCLSKKILLIFECLMRIIKFTSVTLTINSSGVIQYFLKIVIHICSPKTLVSASGILFWNNAKLSYCYFRQVFRWDQNWCTRAACSGFSVKEVMFLIENCNLEFPEHRFLARHVLTKVKA